MYVTDSMESMHAVYQLISAALLRPLQVMW